MGVALRLKKEEQKYSYEDYIKWEDSEDWELIDGAAYNMAPSATPKHQIIAHNLSAEIKIYLKGKTCKVMGETDVVFSDKDIFKPDLMVVCDKEKIREKIFGAPEFIVEILSPSTAKIDKSIKLKKYMKYGVTEYWIVDPVNFEITVFKKGEYNIPSYYDINDEFIPVGIFNDELKISLKDIFDVD